MSVISDCMDKEADLKALGLIRTMADIRRRSRPTSHV